MANAGRGPRGGSGTEHTPGRRTMKEYPITEETLDNIGTLRTSSSLCFAIGSLALGFTLSSAQSLSLAGTGVSEAIAATWTAYTWAGGIVAFGAYIAGGVFFLKGGSVLRKVKDETRHDGSP